MADTDIVQVIAEARIDARSLSEFVFKPADFMVARRLAPSVRTLQHYVDFFNTLQSNIATSVSAAQSSLNSSVAEADGKVAYIETTVQDAINNTAIEGGVLADTFVTKTVNGVGQIARSQRDKNAEYISVHDYGAIGDGTLHTLQEWIDNGRYSSLAEIQAEHHTAMSLVDSVDRVSMQTCIDYCKSIGATAYAVKGNKYFIDKTLIIRSNVDFSDCETTTPETFAGAAFYLGTNPDNPELLYDLRAKLPEIRTPRSYGTPWTPGSVAVKIEGVRNAVIYFDSMGGFETNLLLYSGISKIYITANSFYFNGAFVGAKTNIKIFLENGGWANQCQFWGGHFGVIGTDSQTFSDIRNVEMIKVGATGNNPPNGHTFMGCNMEGGGFEYTIYQSYPDQVSSFLSNNRWVSCRFEATKKMLFDAKAINDTLLCPHLDANVIFEGRKPAIIGDYYRGQVNIFRGIGVDDGLERTPDYTYHISGATTGSNLINTWGNSATYFNAGVTATGNFQVYNNSDATKKHAVVSLGRQFYPGLYMGSGDATPVEGLYRQTENDWRISSSLSPSSNNSVSLGKNGLAYSAVHANVFRGTSGMGLWSVAPPSSKPSVTGLKTPTTIAEQKVVTDSLIAALASYGLIADSRT